METTKPKRTTKPKGVQVPAPEQVPVLTLEMIISHPIYEAQVLDVWIDMDDMGSEYPR